MNNYKIYIYIRTYIHIYIYYISHICTYSKSFQIIQSHWNHSRGGGPGGPGEGAHGIGGGTPTCDQLSISQLLESLVHLFQILWCTCFRFSGSQIVRISNDKLLKFSKGQFLNFSHYSNSTLSLQIKCRELILAEINMDLVWPELIWNGSKCPAMVWNWLAAERNHNK